MKNETKTIVIIPNYRRDEIHRDWKNVLKQCNKKEDGIEYYVHQDSNLEKKLILIDGNRVKGVKSIEDGIGSLQYMDPIDVSTMRLQLKEKGDEIIKYRDFLQELAHQSKVCVMDGVEYLKNKEIELYHSSLKEIFEKKELIKLYPKILSKNVDAYKFPMSQEGVSYTAYTNGGFHSLRPAVRRLENSFDEGFQAIKEYAEDKKIKREENYKRWAEKWSIKKD
ncbi:hypothetical protein KAT36_00040 [Candidatus Pacearchaeota archaeon]|nr:hypothetical protein [Candidatus Pacearchaeota archaeon]